MEEGKSENEWLALHITMQSYNFTYNAMQDKYHASYDLLYFKQVPLINNKQAPV